MLNKWPLAYYNVRLGDHLNCVAWLAVNLFNKELEVLERRVSESNLRDLLYLAGVTHDIGKASRFYEEKFNETKRLTFPYHEIVGALILHATSWKISWDRGGRVLSIAAKIVSRHHAAMTGRHPRDLVQSKSTYMVDHVLNVLREIRVDDMSTLVDELLSRTPRSLSIARIALEELKNKLESVVKEITSGRSRNVVQRDIESLATLDSGESKEYILVASLTGMLMVADNLVANLERRKSSDGMTPLYIMSWSRELSGRLRKLEVSNACPHVEVDGYGC